MQKSDISDRESAQHSALKSPLRVWSRPRVLVATEVNDRTEGGLFGITSFEGHHSTSTPTVGS